MDKFGHQGVGQLLDADDVRPDALVAEFGEVGEGDHRGFVRGAQLLVKERGCRGRGHMRVANTPSRSFWKSSSGQGGVKTMTKR